MKCANCATPIPDDARYCLHCGSQVSDAEGQARASGSMDADSFKYMEELLQEDLAGEFNIERPLGKGGMAIVYLATEVHLARRVAIKVLPPELTFGHGVERFKREAKTAAALDHQNIIPIYRIASGGKIFWYAMKYLEGRSLDELLREKERLSLSDTIHILEQVADALDYAHEHQVIHRDVKPANVMLDARNRVVVTDFGIAKALTEGTLTASGSVVGTPYYMSPEQGMGRPVTGASDQYSVGVMAYRMLSGHVPFEGDSAVEILHKHCTVTPPALETMMPGLPRHVYWAVGKALEKKPERRHATVMAFVDALREPSEEMTLGEQATVVVATPHPDAPTHAPLPPGVSEADVSGETVRMEATPPPTPPSPQPAVGRRPVPVPAAAPQRRRGRRVAMWVALAVVAMGGGAFGARLIFGPAAKSGGGTVSQGERTGANQPGTPSGQTGQGQVALAAAESTTHRGDTATASGAAQASRDTATRETAPPPATSTRPTVAAPTTGTLRLTNVPRGAKVEIDGQTRIGDSFSLSLGTHRITVSAEGYRLFQTSASVTAGQPRTVRFDAARIPTAAAQLPPTQPTATQPVSAVGVLRIRILGGTAEIFIDNVSKGVQRQVRGETLLAGDHQLHFQLPGFQPKDTTVTVIAGDTVTVTIRLERNP